MQTRTAKGQSGSDEDNLLERGLDIQGRVGDPAQMAGKSSVILGGPAAGIWRVQEHVSHQKEGLYCVAIGWNVLCMFVRFIWSAALFKSAVY